MSNNKTTVLIIEDEKAIRNFITTFLSTNGYKTISAKNGTEALSLISSHVPDVILLDLGLPDIDGLEVIRKVRETSSIPIIVISARSFEGEKVKALDMGADDYITKPFGSSELMARIRTALRHSHKVLTKDLGGQEDFITGDLRIDFNARQVIVEGKEIHLTQIEYKLLAILAKYVGRVLTYEFIINSIWNMPSDKNSQQLLRVNMANIRRKIEVNPGAPKYVLTEVGVGYRLADIEA
ncbi:MAG: response regulator transcription factor [Clostridiales bacterium]|nr:response regulator transcription factor [Clostridiales bacterium]MBR6701418.1 response regulator transcription factor [Bacillota bacterium]